MVEIQRAECSESGEVYVNEISQPHISECHAPHSARVMLHVRYKGRGCFMLTHLSVWNGNEHICLCGDWLESVVRG